MPADPLRARKRRQARTCVRVLATQGADAVGLFGSVARGDASAASDIDLLVVSGEPLRSRDLKLPSAPYGLAFTTWRRLAAPGARQWAFLTVIAPETVMLHDPDGRLGAAFAQLPELAPSAEAVAGDFSDVLRKLGYYSDITRFGGLYNFFFADCYRYGKGAILAASAYCGEPQARRSDAFAWFAARHPRTAADLAILHSVEPHYLLDMDKVEVEDLPFPAKGCDELAEAVVISARNIAEVAATDAATALAER